MKTKSIRIKRAKKDPLAKPSVDFEQPAYVKLPDRATEESLRAVLSALTTTRVPNINRGASWIANIIGLCTRT